MRALLTRIWRRLNAAQIAILSFALVILAGALALMLPVSVHGRPLHFVDALFTATSATCVTGLIVVDTGAKFTFFGQLVILLLIQAGGFGIMTISTFILFMVGRRATFSMSDAVSGSFLKLSRYSLSEMLRRALVFTFAFEAGGALLLFSRWIFDFSLRKALWLSVFHSVSAFCNAGFSLFPDSLVGYAGVPSINVVIMILIVSGGIGFFVLIDLWDTLKRDQDPAKRRVSFHTKIVLGMTALLITAGALSIFGIERGHNLAGMSMGQGLMRAFFQSITARTAGFNSMDISRMANASLFLLIILMFIGGAPGSMAGGVKVTTAGVLLMVAVSRLRGAKRPAVFGRSISREDVERAVSLVLVAVTLIVLMTMLLLVTQLGGEPHAQSRGMFNELLFECVSAFGTVGLSMGATPGLTSVGKLVITAMMFMGRLGPLTLIFAMERKKAGRYFRYPEERIMIG